MVEFRNLISKKEPLKKKEKEKAQTDPVKKDRFSFTDLASKEKAEIKKRPEKKPLAPSSRIQFKDIYTQQPKELPPEAPLGESPIEDIETEPLEVADERISYSISQMSPEAEKRRQDLYRAAAKYLHEVLESVRKRRKFSLSTGFKIIHRMVETQPPYDPLFVNAMHQDHPGEYIVYHSVNVSIFAIKMAYYLNFSIQDQVEIGMAGLLHDVGMGFIPEAILFKDGKLSNKERSLLQQRPINSYKILESVGEQYPYLAESAYHVYERIDGSGYPNGLQGDEINKYAQIIGLVSVYEALIHSRPQREKFLHFTAVKEIIKREKRGFHKKHLKALLNIFSIFPLSSFVRLNSNAIGKVIETYPDFPMRPKLQIIFDSQDQKVITDRIIDLSENSLLHIVDSVSEEELATLSTR